MKFLKNMLDNARPSFQKGGKLQAFRSTFDAFDTFLFVPDHTSKTGAHIRDGIDLKRTMFTVVVAMIPALLFGIWNVGFQHFKALGQLDSVTLIDNFWFGSKLVMPILFVSYMVGLGIEFIFAQFNGHQVNEGFLVTGILIPLVMPPTIPLWMVAIATAFAVVIGKEVFGGTGMNLLNPALTARVFLFFAYPAYMAGEYRADQSYLWVAAGRNETSSFFEGTQLVDGFSGSTSLSLAASGKLDKLASPYDMFMGFEMGSIGETSVLAILIGAFILIMTGIGSWKIMLSSVIGALGMGLLLNALSGSVSDPYVKQFMTMPAYYHLLVGGFAFGVVFMATDPVSAAQTEKGKWIYGLLIGIFAVLIRVFNPAYPEGIMLAILLMNVVAPLIDYLIVESNKKRRLSRASF